MSISIDPSQAERIQQLMKAGGFTDEAAVVTAGLELLERKQRLHALVQEGLDDFNAGRVLDHETVFGEVRRRIAEIAAKHEVGAMT